MVWSFKKGGEMSGIEILADTNAILYLFSGKRCMAPFMNMQIGVSVITEMELLSFPRISPQELSNLQLLLSRCIIIPMDNDIKNKAILIRRAYGTKLPDAIVAATSICNHLPFLTADKGFKRIEGLDLNLLELSEV